MTRRALPLLLLAVVAGAGLPLLLRGHTEALFTNAGNTNPIIWPPGASITYRLHNGIATAPNVLAGSNATQAVVNGFTTVGAATGLNFVNGGTTATSTGGTDGTNLVTFANTAGNLAAVGGAVAVTLLTFNLSNFRITEADIIFNPATTFSTTGAGNAQDVESVMVHETGHFVGQRHSPLVHATMFPFSINGSIAGRTLSEDDRSGLRTLYPGTTGPSFATVTGLVRRSPAIVVSGAHVVLRDLVTGRSVTGGATFADGSYSIGSVPPGLYQIYAEPLDNPFPAASLSGGIWNPAGFDTTFKTTFLGGNAAPATVVVRPGQTLNVGTITVAAGPPALNVTGAALTPIPNGFTAYSSTVQTVVPPYNLFLAIGGPGLNTRPDSAFSLPGPFCAITGPSTVSGVLGGSGDGYKIFPVSIAANAPAGGYDLRVRDTATGEVSFMAAALDVTPAAPLPYSAPYHAPCAGSAGLLNFTGVGSPSVGSTTFALSLANTIAGQTGFYLLALRPEALPVLGTCTVAVDVTALLVAFPGFPFPLSGGTMLIPSPIPNLPSIAGVDFYLQIVSTDPGTPGGVALSNGLVVHVQ